MIEPTPPEGAPDYVLQVVSGSLQYSDACLRVYGHPDLLRVAAAINGDDFTPFNEVIFIKQPGLGGSVAWHQDGTTHWDAPIFDKGSHGFNFMAQLYGCNAANGLWIVPGSHLARADIKAMCDAASSWICRRSVRRVESPATRVRGGYRRSKPPVPSVGDGSHW